jgi:Uma2 family endonuclease
MIPMKPVPQSAHARSSSVPPLRQGERLTQAEFHRRYEASPEDVKAELVGGIVYMASPLRRRHAAHHFVLATVLGTYQAGTPGLEGLDNATTILGDEGEPQPDLALRILPEFGGQSGENPQGYVVRAPELLAEVADSSQDIDLHQKRDDYERAGVLEYLVLCVADQQLHWFDFKRQASITPNRRGVSRSLVFPGLWIDGRALLARDSARALAVVQQGLASREHARFVKRLAARRQSS